MAIALQQGELKPVKMIGGPKSKKEPLFHSLLIANHLQIMFNLKMKSKILVPESAILLGVIDEQGILEENEVYIQIRRNGIANSDHD